MQTDDVTVRVQALDGTWETIGVDRLEGVYPEPDSIDLSANSWGSDKASFSLHRDPGAIWPDLSALTPVDIEIGGELVWSGRIQETPTTEGDDRVINVEAEGWQYHLDKNPYDRIYVHTNLGDWKDRRTFPTAPVGSGLLSANAQVTVGDGVITVSFANGDAVANGDTGDVMLDAGPNNLITDVVWTFAGSNNNNAAGQALVYGSTMTDPTGTSNAYFWGPSALTTVGAGTTTAAALATARRYVRFGMNFGGTAPSGDAWLRLTAITVFTNSAWRSGNSSILKASDVIKDALTHAALLSSDQSGISTTSFNIPEFVVPVTAPQTPREVWMAANAFHNYITKIDVYRRPIFKPRPSAALYETGAWANSEFQDASANSSDDIYNKVLVTGTAPDGSPISIVRTTTVTTLADRRGETSKKNLVISSPLITSVAQQIGDVWLAAHVKTPFKGSMVARGHGAVRTVLGGDGVHPARLLRDTGELIRLTDHIDPDTGAVGRDGLIANVRYTHIDRTARIDLDSGRDNVEAFIARLAVVTGSALGQ